MNQPAIIVFQSEDEQSGNDSDSSEPSNKRRRYDPERLEKRREHRLWEEARNKILFEYSEFSGFGTSVCFLSSLFCFN